MMPFNILAAHGLRPGGDVGALMYALKYCSRFSGFFLGDCATPSRERRTLYSSLCPCGRWTPHCYTHMPWAW